MAKKNSIVVGLDIGTSKVCAVVGEMTEHGVEIIGVGTHPSQGLRKGVVINIESTVSSIKKAVEEAELMAGCEIHTVFAGIAGGHIKGFNSHGIVAVKNKEVAQRDLDRVIDAAKAVAIPMDREVLHVLPQDYIIDDQDGINEPLGMSGVRLEARGAYRHRRGDLGAEHRQMLQSQRTQCRRNRACASGRRRSGAHRRRTRVGRRRWSIWAAAPPISRSTTTAR